MRRSETVDKLFFGNVLTQHLRKEEVNEERKFDMIILPALWGTDITSIRAKKDDDGFVFTGAERQDRADSFMVHFYRMLDMQLHICEQSATLEERAHPNERYRSMLMLII